MKSKDMKVLFSSKKKDWGTPQSFFNTLNKSYSFTLDACASPWNAKCKKYFSVHDNALEQDWGGNQVWMNPPYGRGMGAWLEKAATAASSSFGTTVVCLIPARTDTKWWHNHVMKKAAGVYFVKGRLKFENGPSGTENSAPFP